MALAQPFTTASPSIATYSFEDIISGTGIILLYAGNVNNSGTTDYKLSNFQYYSHSSAISTGELGLISSTKVLDLDFDVLVNKTLRFKGEAIINIPISAYAAGADGVVSAFVIAKLRHYDGTTETDVASVTLEGIEDFGTDNTTTYKLSTGSMTVPLTTFREGDTIRLTIELWCEASGNSTCKANVVNDPKGRTVGTLDSSQLTIQLPTRLDL